MTDEIMVAQVKGILADKFGVEINVFDNDVYFKDDLGVDSLDMIEATMQIEKELNIVISDEDVEKLGRLNSLLLYISQQLELPPVKLQQHNP